MKESLTLLWNTNHCSVYLEAKDNWAWKPEKLLQRGQVHFMNHSTFHFSLSISTELQNLWKNSLSAITGRLSASSYFSDFSLSNMDSDIRSSPHFLKKCFYSEVTDRKKTSKLHTGSQSKERKTWKKFKIMHYS